MCLSPNFIKVDLQPCSSPSKMHWKRLDKDVSNLLRPYHFSYLRVPCGKCVQCLKDRSNDLAIRSYLAAQKYGSMHFLTLTYSPEHLPLTARLCMVDKNTGEVFHDSNYKFVSEKCPQIAEMRRYFVSNKGSKARYWYVNDVSSTSTDYIDSDYDYYVHVTPSLDRRDVRLWLKRSRVTYERKFGKKLPDFKKICIGEFGPRTCRPHYHLAFFGLNNDEMQFLANEWNYGFHYLETVSHVNKDGSNGWLAAAKYVGKYISKGIFDCDSVLRDDVEKPRLFCSCNLFELPKNVIEYYRCYDLFGHYDLDSLFISDSGRFLNLLDLQKLHEETLKRSKININGFLYKLPRSLIKKIWFTKDEITKTFKASSVRIALASFMEHDVTDDFIKEYRQSNPEATRLQVLDALRSFQVCDEYTKQIVAQNQQRSFYESFTKSIF